MLSFPPRLGCSFVELGGFVSSCPREFCVSLLSTTSVCHLNGLVPERCGRAALEGYMCVFFIPVQVSKRVEKPPEIAAQKAPTTDDHLKSQVYSLCGARDILSDTLLCVLAVTFSFLFLPSIRCIQ